MTLSRFDPPRSLENFSFSCENKTSIEFVRLGKLFFCKSLKNVEKWCFLIRVYAIKIVITIENKIKKTFHFIQLGKSNRKLLNCSLPKNRMKKIFVILTKWKFQIADTLTLAMVVCWNDRIHNQNTKRGLHESHKVRTERNTKIIGFQIFWYGTSPRRVE